MGILDKILRAGEGKTLRTLEGIARHIELVVDRREPVKRVGVACRWCPLRDSCPEGKAYLGGTDPDAGIAD